MINLRTAVGTLVTALAFVGCGSPTDGAATGGGKASAGATSGGSSGAGDGGIATKGGATNNGSGSGGGAGTGATSAGTTGTGDAVDYIGTLQVIRTLAPPGSTLASARFDFVGQPARDALASGESCPQETYGTCVVTKCPVEAEMDPNPPSSPSNDHLDAGTITMTADKGSFSSTGTPTKAYRGYAFESNGSLTGAELVTISATGGTVSAFSAPIQVPLAPLLLMPSLEGSQAAVDVPVSRATDFTFSWDARGASQRLQLVVDNPLGTTGQPWLSCNFDAPAGTGTFQVGALSQFPVGTRIRVFSVNSAAVETPEGPVAIMAALELVSSDKASFPTFVLK